MFAEEAGFEDKAGQNAKGERPKPLPFRVQFVLLD